MLAVLLSGLLLLGWDLAMGWIYPQRGSPAVTEQTAPAPEAPAPEAPAPEAKATHTREGGLNDPAQIAEEKRDLASALKSPARVPIQAPGLSGSINLVGAVLDDLTVNRHRASRARSRTGRSQSCTSRARSSRADHQGAQPAARR